MAKSSEHSEKTGRFIGFYLKYRGVGNFDLRPRDERPEQNTCEFYKQVFKLQGYYGKLDVHIDGHKVKLAESHMTLSRAKPANYVLMDSKEKLEFYLFQGDFIKAMQCGSVLVSFLEDILRALGMTKELKGVQNQIAVYEKAKKSNPSLRAFYWSMSQLFFLKLPTNFNIAFTVDCLLYGEWRVNHPNIVGLHMMALAWMLGVPEFRQFLPEGLVREAPFVVASPPFAGALEKMSIRVKLPAFPPPLEEHPKLQPQPQKQQRPSGK